MSIIWSSFSYFNNQLSYGIMCITCIRCKVSHFYNISHNVVKTSHVYSKNITYISKYICMYNCLSIWYINVSYYVLYKAMTCKKLLYHYIGFSLYSSQTLHRLFLYLMIYNSIDYTWDIYHNFGCHIIWKNLAFG